jgi:hypothetical protein
MSPDKYRQVMNIYGDKVRWVIGPLSPLAEKAYNIASKTLGQRKGNLKEIAHLEILALLTGFSLRDNKSITDLNLSLKAEKEIIDRLITEQVSKPLWTFVRTGSDSDHINYYMGAEYWCVYDDLPLLKSEFESNIGHDGKPKPFNSCSFCRGIVIADHHKPIVGETVIQRPESCSSGKVAKYVGFLGGLFHPDKFALPGCFTEPNHMIPPQDSIVL